MEGRDLGANKTRETERRFSDARESCVTKTIYTSCFVRKETRVFVFEESINKMCKLLPIFEIIVFVSGKFLHRFYRPSFHCFTCTSYCFCFRGFSPFPFLEFKWVIAFSL